MRAVEASEFIEAIAAEDETGVVLWLANSTGVEQRVMLPGPARDLFRLDAGSFVDAARDPEAASNILRSFQRERTSSPPLRGGARRPCSLKLRKS